MNEKEYITYLLQEAKRLESIGQKGLAASRYEQVLEYEPENEEARGELQASIKSQAIQINYIILAHQHLSLQRLINSLDNDKANIFLHYDLKSDIEEIKNITSKKSKIFLIRRESVFWGHFSIVQATINGLKLIDLNERSYTVLLSGSDYPIKSQEYIYSYLMNSYPNSFISHSSLPTNYWTNGGMNRIERHYIINNGINSLNLNNNETRNLPYNMRPFGGSSWWVFSNLTVSYIHKIIENYPLIKDFYSTTLLPDEMFFQTILMNDFRSYIKKDANIVNDNLRYTDWSMGGSSPKELSHEDFDSIRSSNALFARKFNGTNSKILDMIDNFIN